MTTAALTRRHALIEMLMRSPRRLSSRELCDRLEERGFIDRETADPVVMVRRDLERLQKTYTALRHDDDKPRGWWLEKDGRALPPMAPAVALWFSMMEESNAALPPAARAYMRDYSEHARQVLAESPKWSAWRERVAMIPSGQPTLAPEVNLAIVDTIHTALVERRVLEMVYAANDGIRDPRPVHPLAFVSRGNRIYFVCMYERSPMPIPHHVHRMLSARVLDVPCKESETFKLSRYLEMGGLGRRISKGPVRLVLLAEKDAARELADFRLVTSQHMRPHADGRVLIEMEILDSLLLRSHLLSFGDKLEVIEPLSMREKFAEKIATLAERYKNPEPLRSYGTRAGVARARQEGVRVGRPNKAIDLDRLLELRTSGASLENIASTMSVSIPTVRKALRQAKRDADEPLM